MDRVQESGVRGHESGDGAALPSVLRPPSSDLWHVAGLTLRSRVLLGTSRYPSLQTLLDALDASGAGLVTVAMNECRRVGQLIGKLKSYQPPAPEDLEPLDVHQVIDEILQSNMDTFNNRAITLEKQYSDDIPAIDGISQQIRQALNNIVKNAEESLSDDAGKITISTEQDGSHVKIHIRDTGCGIRENDLDRIFDPFYTTKSALHRPGLGLLASLGIIKNHQGEIDVHSQPGQGTTFTVTLPFKQADNPNNGQS